jgi:hypothetical protein
MRKIKYLLFGIPLLVVGQIQLSNISSIVFSNTIPGPPINVSTTVNGTPGHTIYNYWVVANYPNGLKSTPSTVATSFTSPDVLSASNYVTVTWTPVSGAVSYDVLKTNSFTLPSSGNIALATNVAGNSVNDTGQALSAYTVATTPAPSTCTATYDVIHYNPGQLIIPCLQGGGGGGMTNPMTQLGDLIVGGSGGVPTRLGVGANGTVLTVSGGVPTWQPSPQTITLQTNGTNNGSQTLLNLVAGTNVTLTNSGGNVTIAASGGSGGIQTGTLANRPATCTTGQLYFATDQPALQQLNECSSTNTWTVDLNLGGSGALQITNGSLDIVPSVVPTKGAPNIFTALNEFTQGLTLDALSSSPGTPASGKANIYVNSNDGQLHLVTSSGTDTPVGGGVTTKIASVTLTTAAPTITISNIPGTYSKLIIDGVISSGFNASYMMLINGDTAADYNWSNIILTGNGNAPLNQAANGDTGIKEICHTETSSPTPCTFSISIPFYANTAFPRNVIGVSTGYGTSGFSRSEALSGTWLNTSNAITSVTFQLDGSLNLAVGSSVIVYGVQ